MGMKDVKAMTPPQETRISDLGLAAFLLCQDYNLVRVDSASGRVEFVFASVPEEVLFEFYSGGAMVNARKLLAAHRDLKGLIFDHERRQR